jgi:hypothetical protein
MSMRSASLIGGSVAISGAGTSTESDSGGFW